MNELDRVENEQLVEFLPVLSGELRAAGFKAIGAGAGIDDNGQMALVGPAIEALNRPVDRSLIRGLESFRRKRNATAVSGRIAGQKELHPRSFGQIKQRLHVANSFLFAGQSAHNARDTRRIIDRVGAGIERERQRPAARHRHRIAPVPEGSVEQLAR